MAGVAKTEPGFLDSSVGKKVLMAITGVILFGFVTVHMLGNMTAYMGRPAMNEYAELLQTMIHGKGIWVFRIVLLVTVVLHAWTAWTLTNLNSAARSVGYREKQNQKATLASRSMRYTGVILGLFIIYHLLHLTTGTLHPDFIKGDAYHNFVTGFQKPLAAAFYIVAQVCLGFHLWHGVWSFTQTLGWYHPRYNACRRTIASVFGVVIPVVNISFPLAVLTGLIHL